MRGSLLVGTMCYVINAYKNCCAILIRASAQYKKESINKITNKFDISLTDSFLHCLLYSRIRESNPPPQLGKLIYYRCTNPAFGSVQTSNSFILAAFHSHVKSSPAPPGCFPGAFDIPSSHRHDAPRYRRSFPHWPLLPAPWLRRTDVPRRCSENCSSTHGHW